MRRHGPVITHCTDSEDFPKGRRRFMGRFRSSVAESAILHISREMPEVQTSEF